MPKLQNRLLLGLDQEGEGEALSRSMTSGDDLSKRKMHGEGSIGVEISMDCVKLDMGQAEKKPCLNTKVHSSLQQEILQLENRLQEQFKVRSALEAALGFRSSSFAQFSPTSMPKPATDLIREIAVLELEVVYLEQYLLSLYRKAFDQQVASASPLKRDKTLSSDLETPRGSFLDARTPHFNALSNREQGTVQSACQPLNKPSKNGTSREKNQINRCHSALPQSSGFAVKASAPLEGSTRALRACHSETFSMAEASTRPVILFILLETIQFHL